MASKQRSCDIDRFDVRLTQARADQRGQSLGLLLDGFRQYLTILVQQNLDADLRVKVGDSDVVQDVFVVAHERFDQFQGHSEEELRAWLARILINRCRDVRDVFVSAQRRSVLREIPLRGSDSSGDFATALAPSDESPRRMAIASEDSARIIAALSLLPADWQQIVWLRNWERQTFEEIGQQLGRSADVVRKTFLRAIEKLGTLLKDIDETESKSER